MADAQPAAGGRRTIRVAQLLLVVCAAGLWAASRLTWVELNIFDGLGPPRLVRLSGCGVVVGTTAVGVTAAGHCAGCPGGARVGAADARGAGGRGQPGDGVPGDQHAGDADVAVRGAELARVPVMELVGSTRRYPGPVITLVAAVGILVAAALLMRAAASAGGTGTKYLAPAARRSAVRRGDDAQSERTMWDEIDEGRDPTDPSDDPPAEPDSEGR